MSRDFGVPLDETRVGESLFRVACSESLRIFAMEEPLPSVMQKYQEASWTLKFSRTMVLDRLRRKGAMSGACPESQELPGGM